jgi:hypothetical protein
MDKSLKIAVRDFMSIIRFGPHAPKYAEQIWIPISNCLSIAENPISRKASGLVLDSNWDQNVIQMSDIENHFPKIKACYQHWGEGVSWEETGIYKIMSDYIARKGRADNCENMSEIKDRYRRLDEIFLIVKKEKRLRTMQEIDKKSFREEGAVYFHIDRKCRPVFGGGGQHRLAMAIILGIEIIPAQLGVVHPDALKELSDFRKFSFQGA